VEPQRDLQVKGLAYILHNDCGSETQQDAAIIAHRVPGMDKPPVRVLGPA